MCDALVNGVSASDDLGESPEGGQPSSHTLTWLPGSGSESSVCYTYPSGIMSVFHSSEDKHPLLRFFKCLADSEGRTRGYERPAHWGASMSPGPPFGLQMVIGVGLLDRGEKRARRVPEKGVSGKVYKSDPSLAL